MHLQRRRFLLTPHGYQMLIVPTPLSFLLALLLIQKSLMLQRQIASVTAKSGAPGCQVRQDRQLMRVDAMDAGEIRRSGVNCGGRGGYGV